LVQVFVEGNIDAAIKSLKRRMAGDGILGELKLRIAKKSERRKVKARKAASRKRRTARRYARYAERR
jgi:ribosomal protein S21